LANLQIPDEDLWKTWPTLGGFTFAKKKWGELYVGGLTEVEYDAEAFSKLVFPTEKKELIKSFILHSEGMKNDLISGKGGGALFLLHGPPGCGKTLTAEAIAELLKRPLYKVDCGELTAHGLFQVEQKLSELLELASQWNAVVLIDEADIFLEKRSSNNIDRNAVVGTFLRLLEYYTGVLFLTTNRVHDFDEAFYSRIQVKLKYYELEEDARRQVWKNFLLDKKQDALGTSITDSDIAILAAPKLNGREIRNVIQLAKALARGESSALTRKHVERVVALYLQFDREMKDAVDTQTTKELNQLKRSAELKRSIGL
jgi:SpoVK/Ycf46/Vps4 family AAA+-type ATPase